MAVAHCKCQFCSITKGENFADKLRCFVYLKLRSPAAVGRYAEHFEIDHISTAFQLNYSAETLVFIRNIWAEPDNLAKADLALSSRPLGFFLSPIRRGPRKRISGIRSGWPKDKRPNVVCGMGRKCLERGGGQVGWRRRTVCDCDV